MHSGLFKIREKNGMSLMKILIIWLLRKRLNMESQKKDLDFYFNEFDIYDTRAAQKECWTCKNKSEKECPVHKFKLMENPLIKEE